MKKIIFLLLLTSLNSHADINLPSIDTHYANYKGLHNVMQTAVENDDSLSTSQKMAEYTRRLEKLKSNFRSKRRNEYVKVEKVLSKGNSCTKHSSGGSKRCDKYIDAPANYYTKTEWTEKFKENGKSMNRQATVDKDGKRVWSKIKKSGKGRYYEKIKAKFRLESAYIEKSLNTDTTNLFNRIVGI